MFTSASRCDENRLKRLIDDDLSDAEQADLARHVDACSNCRKRLERLAADEDWWNRTREFLSGLTEDVTSKLTDADSHEPMGLGFLDPSDNPAMLGRLGEYEILEVIGRGGMGVVLKGYDHELNRYVAVKVLAPQWASSGAARKRFAREGQAAAAVVHHHVLAIHSVNATHRLPYLVMPYIAGESLQQRLDREGPLNLLEILRIALQVSEGLAAAHAQGLVHRDIKPANILLEKSVERVLLTDFSLARAVDDASVTRSGVIAGTPQYMSPEQAKGEPIDNRSDLFSIGSVIYAMCTGHPPFRAESTLAILRRICDSEPRPLRQLNPNIPNWLWAIVASLLNKQPENRIASAKQLADLLGSCLAHVQQPSVVRLPKSLPRSPTVKSQRVQPWIAGLLLSGVFLVCCWFWQYRQHPAPSVEPDLQTNQKTTPTGPELHASETQPIATSQASGTSLQFPIPDLSWDDSLARDFEILKSGINRLEQATQSDEFPSEPESF